MNIISVSYGNDSIAMLQWAYEKKINDVLVVYCDTGWAHSSWAARIQEGKKFSESYGFEVHHIHGELSFPDMVRMKKGFPSQRYQFCTGILKGIPFLEFCEKVDPDKKATVIIGKRRDESRARANTPEFVEQSEYHEGRKVWHPLYKHTEIHRDDLVSKTCFPVLPHRSLECSPCVNANKKDLLLIEQDRIKEIIRLEVEIGKPMFRAAKKMGATGINQVLEWASCPRGQYGKKQNTLFPNSFGIPCQTGLCGG